MSENAKASTDSQDNILMLSKVNSTTNIPVSRSEIDEFIHQRDICNEPFTVLWDLEN